MSVKRLVLLGVVAYGVFLLARFPAAAAVSWFTPDSVQVSQPSGTIWSGEASLVRADDLSLGATTWSFAPLSLVKGRVGVNLSTTIDGSQLEATVARGLGNRVFLSDLSGVVPLQRLPGLMDPNLYAGTVGLDITSLTLEDGWPVDAEGTVDIVSLSAMQPSRREVGSYEVSFDGTTTEPLIAAITDVDGLLAVNGSISFSEGRKYLLDVAVTPRPGTPRELVNVLELLGEASPDGSRRLVLEGTAP
ncbi:MAG: type II secretion system protein N [Pseudomonadota bacterium]